MHPISLTMALGPYDHVRDVTEGYIPVQGVHLTTLNLPIEEIFYRFTMYREWDISEMSMAKYLALRASEEAPVTALPVFISRAFRHSMFYVTQGSAIRRPEDLLGKRIGIPEWAQTAGVYARGFLSDYLGLDLRRMQWIQAGVNDPGRVEKVSIRLPHGFSYQSVPTRSLNDMLLAGEIDAIMSARPPRSLGAGIERLIADYQTAEEQYFRDTGIYPIMHGLVIKREALDRHPWVAMNLYKAFLEAKNRSLERMSDITASFAPLAWLAEYADRMRKLFGADFFPYGIGQDPGGRINYATLDAFCRFGFDQGVCQRKLAVEELFPKNVLSSFKI